MEALLIKAKIDAGADDIVSEENSSSVGPAVIEKIIRGPEVGMDIFNLHRPLRRECPFNAAACGPSGATVGYDQTACSGATNLNATIGKGGASGTVEQPLAPHVAEPAAQCVDPRSVTLFIVVGTRLSGAAPCLPDKDISSSMPIIQL